MSLNMEFCIQAIRNTNKAETDVTDESDNDDCHPWRCIDSDCNRRKYWSCFFTPTLPGVYSIEVAINHPSPRAQPKCEGCLWTINPCVL